MRVAHFSDLHISAGPRLADQAADLHRLVDEMLAFDPELVLLTGDLFGMVVPYRPTPEERAVLEPELIRLGDAAQVIVVQGNHDHRVALERIRDLAARLPIRVCTQAELVQVPARDGSVATVYVLPYPTKGWLLGTEGTALGVDEARQAVERRLASLFSIWRARMLREPGPHILAAHMQVGGVSLAGAEVPALQEIEVSRKVLADLPIAYGALGHIHRNQQLATNHVWYAGSPWPTDFSEGKGDLPVMHGWMSVEIGDGWTTARQHHLPQRRWFTFEWRWAADREDGAPRWITRPLDVDLGGQVRGARVRCRVLLSDAHATSCPWADELARLEAAGVHEIRIERRVEPTLRVRSALPAGETLPEKLDRYWLTLASPPLASEREAALEALAVLELPE